MSKLEDLKKDLLEKRKLIDDQIAEIDSINKKPIVVETANMMFKRVANKPVFPRYATGIRELDQKLNGGLMLGTFGNIAGQNFAGKTTLLLKILVNIAEGHKVLFFSFEMYENLFKKKIEGMSKNQNSLNNLLIEQKHRHLDDMVKIITEQATKGIKIFGIDSIMKIETNEKEEYQQASKISRTFAKLTQELGIVILLINQISEGDQRSGRLGFKKSGDIAYDSDFSLFILANKDKNTGEVTNRFMYCTKDRINERTWRIPMELLAPKYVEIEFVA